MAEEYKIIRITTNTAGGITDAAREDIASSAVTFTVSGLTVSQDLTVDGQFNSSGNNSFGTISASTIYSGSTNLYDIFITSADGNDITRVQPGTNITTGGTANEPTINLADNVLISSLSAVTISGGTIYGDGSNITNITVGTETVIVGENVSSGDVLYLNTDGNYWKASNTSEVTSSTELRLANATILADASGAVIKSGPYTTTGLLTGVTYWLGTTGSYTSTQPTGDGNIVRYIGTPSSATVLEFNPDELYIEISSSSGPGTQPGLRNVSASGNILVSDFTVNVISTGATTQTLPTAIGVIGKIYNVVNSGGGVITVATTSSQTINGSTGITMTEQYLSRTFQSDDSNWIIL